MLIELLEDIREGDKIKATHGNVLRRHEDRYVPILDIRFKAAWRAGLFVEAEQPEAEALIAEGKARAAP